MRTSATSRRSAPSSSTDLANCRKRSSICPQIVAIKTLCRRANVERIEVGPKGAVLALRDNIFANPDGLISYIAKHPVGARVRPDQKVVFFDEWDTAEERLKGATDILRALVGIAEKGRRRREKDVDRSRNSSPPGLTRWSIQPTCDAA